MILEDFAELSRLHHDSTVMATLGGIRSDVQTQIFLAEKLDHWAAHGFGMWMFRDRTSGEFVGRGGLQHIEVGGSREVEVGYTVDAAFQGRGYATEMASAMVGIGFGVLDFPSLVSFTLPDNLASRRVMEKCGFAFERAIVHAGADQVLYRLHRPGGPMISTGEPADRGRIRKPDADKPAAG